MTDWRSKTLERGEAHGLEFIVLGLPAGHRCGYVRVPEDHPWFGVDYMEAPGEPRSDGWVEGYYEKTPEGQVRVHGGLTYAGERPGEDCEKGWWFGFDCAHLYDAKDPDLMSDRYKEIEAEWGSLLQPGAVVRTTSYVVNECHALAEQLVVAS